MLPKIKKEMEKECRQLAEILKTDEISKFNLTSLGNSIASGYSLLNRTYPLLYRDSTFQNVMINNGIETNIYHFARYQNNNDEHIGEWIFKNISQKEILELMMTDARKVDTPSSTINLREIDVICKYLMDDDRGLKDILTEQGSNLSNIVLYFGGTGSFLDNVTRHGNHISTYGIKRDMVSMEANLKTIQNINRNSDAQTQTYLIAAPRIFNLPIADIFINRRINDISKNYANASFVPSFSKKVLYSGLPDTHYNEDEYNYLYLKMIKAIKENYLVNKAMINIDKELYQKNSLIDENIDLYKLVTLDMKKGRDSSAIQTSLYGLDKVYNIIEKWCLYLGAYNVDINKFLNKLKYYLLERYPYDYYYIGKKNIKKTIERVKTLK